MLFVTDWAHATGPRVAIETAAGGTEHGHGALIGLLGHLSEGGRFLHTTKHKDHEYDSMRVWRVNQRLRLASLRGFTPIKVQCCHGLGIRLGVRGQTSFFGMSLISPRNHMIKANESKVISANSCQRSFYYQTDLNTSWKSKPLTNPTNQILH